MNSKNTNYIPELEGLRGILAIWVLISHLMWGSGFTPDKVNGLWIIPFSGGVPVNIFIILSGFVIFLLLDSKQINYLEYIVRRFFRLYPVFFVTSLVGLFLFWEGYGILGGNYSGPNVFVRGGEYYSNKLVIAISQLSMFHGFLRDLGPIVINPPSWSVSLEWQFYLVAPLLFYLFQKNWLIVAVSVSLFGAFKQFFHPSPFLNMHGATLFDASSSFLTGILSYRVYKYAITNGVNIPLIKTIKGIFLVYTLSSLLLFILNSLYNQQLFSLPWVFSIGIWGWVLLTVILRRLNDASHLGITSKLLTNNLLLYIGKISYSIYLTHQLVIFIFLLFFGVYINKIGLWSSLMVEIVFLVPLTIFVSHYINKYIENPGIIIGKKIAVRLQ